MFSYILAAAGYVVMCNWIQIRYLLGSFLWPGNHKPSKYQNPRLLKIIQDKTNLSPLIHIVDMKEKMIGFMTSSPPFKPAILFSEKLATSFNDDEMEWVILHECAHYLMWHNVKFAGVQITYLILMGAVHFYFHLFTGELIIIAIALAVGYIQTAKLFEYQADTYAASHMGNPHGMITGNIKMGKANNRSVKGSLLRQLFTIAVPYEERIRLAEKYLQKK